MSGSKKREDGPTSISNHHSRYHINEEEVESTWITRDRIIIIIIIIIIIKSAKRENDDDDLCVLCVLKKLEMRT